jgi:hypothetical protein
VQLVVEALLLLGRAGLRRGLPRCGPLRHRRRGARPPGSCQGALDAMAVKCGVKNGPNAAQRRCVRDASAGAQCRQRWQWRLR